MPILHSRANSILFRMMISLYPRLHCSKLVGNHWINQDILAVKEFCSGDFFYLPQTSLQLISNQCINQDIFAVKETNFLVLRTVLWIRIRSELHHFGGSDPHHRARIFKPLKSPGIDFKELIPSAYVAWRAGTTTLFLLGS